MKMDNIPIEDRKAIELGMNQFVYSALENLKKRREIINFLNVFPVPDGDTGTNMYVTLLSCFEELKNRNERPINERLKGMLDGAIKGSRGNSGFILAQFIEGAINALADGESKPLYDAALLTESIEQGAKVARESVLEPLEGTILTVLSDIAASLKRGKPENICLLVKTAHEEACESLRRTPLILKPLAEAGVVDSGGAGIVAILEGLMEALECPFECFEWKSYEKMVSLPSYDGPKWEVEFTLDIKADKAKARAKLLDALKKTGESVVVAGSNPLKVHVHCDQHEEILSFARTLGNIRDLDLQEFPSRKSFNEVKTSAPNKLGVIAFSCGPGLSSLFADLGCQVIESLPGARPGTSKILEKIGLLGSEFIIILPNDPDLIPCAIKAAEISRSQGRNVELIPTKSPVQAISALDEFTEGEEIFEIFEKMKRAASETDWGMVAWAIRSVRIFGVSIKEGEYFGVASGKPVVSSSKLTYAVIETCKKIYSEGKCASFLFISGEELSENISEEIRAEIENNFPGVNSEWLYGGQQYYPLLIGARKA
ncbi:MAG: DAK2 domain-containing protein [Actinomycetota bacterium]|nr:DAK2 domain-containing protein [Actinomycetota bacterium]